MLRLKPSVASLSNGGGGVGGEGVLESAARTGGMMRTRSRGPSLSSVVLMASRSSATPRIAVSPPTPARSSSAMATEPAAPTPPRSRVAAWLHGWVPRAIPSETTLRPL